MKQLLEFLINSKSTGIIKVNINNDFVDFELRSGNLWATCNLGAKCPEEFGHYYMWASKTPNENDKCNLDNCPYFKRNINISITDRKNWDNKYKLNDEIKFTDDVAYIDSNKNAQMPSSQDFEELIKNTEQSIEDLNGVNGVLFFSIKNDKTLFIPYAGYKHSDWFGDRNLSASLWTSTLHKTNYHMAYIFYVDNKYCLNNHTSWRCNANPIRPVKKVKYIDNK